MASAETLARLPPGSRSRRRSLAIVAALLLPAGGAWAWGDVGHEVVALIAWGRLDAPVRDKIQQLLATDTHALRMADGRMTNVSFATQATWPDYYRQSQGPAGLPYQQTHRWHFADIEIKGGTLDQACFSYPALPPGLPASEGAEEDCVVDKIVQFKTELASPATAPAERLLALKYLLHFVGDVHQPLHASDDHDAGGNAKRVSAAGIPAGKLHHYWDTEFVLRLPAPQRTADAIAATLAPRITASQAHQWSSPDPRAWALEANATARSKAYGELPPPKVVAGVATYALSPAYVNDATAAVRVQLEKAGVRLALLLNDAMK